MIESRIHLITIWDYNQSISQWWLDRDWITIYLITIVGLESQSDWAERVFTSVNQICDDLIATGRPGTSPVRSRVGPDFLPV